MKLFVITIFFVAISGCSEFSTSQGSSHLPAASAANFANNILSISGSLLDTVTSLSVSQNGTMIPFTIISQTASLIIGSLSANATVQAATPLTVNLGTVNANSAAVMTIDLSNTTVTNFSSTGITDGASAKAMTIAAGGQVGIGNTVPSNLLEVGSGALGSVLSGNAIAVSSSTAKSGIFVGQDSPDFGGLVWIYNSTAANGYLSLSDFNGTHPLALQRGGGNVGVGTATPQATLDVNGTFRLASNTAAPAVCVNAVDGNIARTSHYTLCICNGNTGSWVAVSDGATACTW